MEFLKIPDRSDAVRFLADRNFWLALSAGPCCWLAVLLLGLPVREQALPMSIWLMGVLINPIIEEIVFRGGIQDWLHHRYPWLRRPLHGLLLDQLYQCNGHFRWKRTSTPVADACTESAANKVQGAISLANVLTSLLFAALHLIRHPPLWAALVIFPSLVFGWAKDRHETLLSPILLHIGYNLGYYWLFAAPYS